MVLNKFVDYCIAPKLSMAYHKTGVNIWTP